MHINTLKQLSLEEIENIDCITIKQAKAYLETILSGRKDLLVDAILKNDKVGYAHYLDYKEYINSNMLRQTENYKNYSYKDLDHLIKMWSTFNIDTGSIYGLLCRSENFFKDALLNKDAFEAFEEHFSDYLKNYINFEFGQNGLANAEFEQRRRIMNKYNLQESLASIVALIKGDGLENLKKLSQEPILKNLNNDSKKSLLDASLAYQNIRIYNYFCEIFSFEKDFSLLVGNDEAMKETCKKNAEFFAGLCHSHYFTDEQLRKIAKPLSNSQRLENVKAFLSSLDDRQLSVFLPEAEKQQDGKFKKLLKLYIAKNNLENSLEEKPVMPNRMKI